MEESDDKITVDESSVEQSRVTQMENSIDLVTHYDYRIKSMNALEILRETVRILRFNCAGFMKITAVFICPVTAFQLSNLLVDHTIVRRLSIRLLLIVRTCGLPLIPVVKQSCQRFSELAVSIAVCFPLYVTLSLLARTAVVYCVECSYSKKNFDGSECFVIVKKLWRRAVVTYVCACMAIVGVVVLFFVLLMAVCNVFLMFGFALDWIMYPGIVVGFLFSVVFANAFIICNIAVVTSVLEDVSGPQALLRSSELIRGQIQVGLVMYVMSTTGMACIQGLFDHRVKTLSYGDGSSRVWEGPLLVLMYSFVVLIDYMMTTVFYFSCRSFSIEAADEEAQPILEMVSVTSNGTSDERDGDAT